MKMAKRTPSSFSISSIRRLLDNQRRVVLDSQRILKELENYYKIPVRETSIYCLGGNFFQLPRQQGLYTGFDRR